MNNYAVFLMGEDFMLSRDGSMELYGFFVTVRVETDTEEEAGVEAIKIVKSDPELADAFKADTIKAPKIEVRVVHHLLPDYKMKKTKYTYFLMAEV